MRFRNLLLALPVSALVLSGCSDTGDYSEAQDETEAVYCVDAKNEIVDPDYCDPDESEYDAMNYYLWYGLVGATVYHPGDHLSSSHASRGHKTRPTRDAVSQHRPGTTRAVPRPSSSGSRPSVSNGGGSRNTGSSVRPNSGGSRPAAPAPRGSSGGRK